MNNRPFLAVFAGCWLGEITACNDVRMVFAALLFSGIFVLFFKKQMYEWRRAVLFSFAGFMLGALMFLYQNERFTRQEKALKGSEQVRAAGTAEWKGKTKKKEFLLLSHVYLPDRDLYLDGDVMVYDDDFDHILPGNKVVLTGELLAHEGPSNLGENDMRIYYLSRNIGFTMFPDKKETLGQEKNFWKSRLFSIRNRMSEHLSSQYGEEIRPIFEAMILGDKTDISEDLKDTFTQSGIVHILAISGLHISLAGAGIYRRLRGAGVSLCLSGAAGLMFAFSYCVMTGMSGSSKRALLMFFFFVLSQVCGRSYDLLSSGGMAGFLLLLESPFRCMDAGFLMSMGAVVSAGIYREVLPARKQKTFKDRQINRFVFCIVVQIIMMPILLYFQYECYPFSFIFNFLMLPLVTAGFTAGFLSAFLPVFLFSVPASVLFSLIVAGTKLSRRLPVQNLVLGKPSFLWIILFYTGLCLMHKTLKKRSYLKYACLLACGCFLALDVQKGQDKISFLDVGQGDCIALSLNRQDMILVDGGSSSKQDVGRYIIAPYIKSQGYQAVSAAVITHLDSDHYSGIRELLPSGMIRRLYLPRVKKDHAYMEIEKEAEQYHVPVGYLSMGSKFSGTDWSMECLHPKPDTGLEKNSASLVFRLKVQDLSVLLTGDLENEGEEMLVRSGIQHADILKVGHHGSKNGTGEDLLRQLSPEIAIVSAGKNNRYGHPHRETVRRLKDSGCNIYETAGSGMLWFSVKRKRWYLNSKLDIIKQ